MNLSKEARFPAIGFLVLATILSLAVRIYTAGWGGLSHDEALCVNIATAPSWEQMFHHIEGDGNPPLFYVLLRLWSSLLGGSDLSLRLFAVMISAAIVPIAYLLFRKDAGEGIATQLAVLLIFCAPLVDFGCLVRSYGLLPILSLLVTWQLMRLLKNPQPGEQVKYGLLLALIVYLHHWGAMVAIGHGVLILGGWLRKSWTPHQIKSWAIAAGGAVLAYLPWVFVLARQLHSGVSPWITTPGWDQCLFYWPVQGIAGYQYQPEWAYYANLIWANLATWSSLVIPSAVHSKGKEGADNLPPQAEFKSRPWQVVIAGGLFAAMIVSQFRSIWRDRYLTAFSPLTLLCYAVVCTRVTRRLPSWLSWGLPIALWMLTWTPQLLYFHKFPESAGWALTEQIARQMNPKKDLIVVSCEAIAPQIDRYLPSQIKMVSFPDIERVRIYRWAGADERIRDQGQFTRLLNLMQSTLDSGGNVWLIESYYKYRPYPVDYSLQVVPYYSVERIRMSQIRRWLEEHARKVGKDDFCAPGREFPIRASHFLPAQ